MTHAILCICWTAVFLTGAAPQELTVTKQLALYRDARSLEDRQQYDKAIEQYGQMTDPILSEAARYHSAICLLRTHRHDEAMAMYKPLLEDESLILYRGEMLLTLAQERYHDLERPRDEILQEVQRDLQQALAWIDDMGTSSPVIVNPELPTIGSFDLAGRYDVMNPATAPWYAPWFRGRVRLFQLFILTETANKEVRLEAYEVLCKTNVLIASITHEDLLRLRWEAERGCYFVPAEAWDNFSDKHGPSLKLGYFYYVAGRYDLARPLFQTVERATADGGGTALDWASAVLGVSLCDFREGRLDRAIPPLDRFNTLFRTTPLGPLGRYVLANMLAGSSSGGGKSERYRDAIRLYGDIARDHPESPYADASLLAMALCAATHNDLDPMYDALDRCDKESLHTKIIGSLISLVSGQSSGNVKPARYVPASEVVEVHDLTWSLTYPPTTKLSPPWPSPADNQLIRCEMSVHSQLPDLAVTSHGYVLTELEPQTPPTYGGHHVIYRAPLLMRPR